MKVKRLKILDITNLDAVRQMVKETDIKAIVNCAAYTNVDKAESDQEFCELLNAKAPENLAISIHVEETHEPWVTLKVQGCHDEIRFKASDAACLDELKSISTMQDEVKSIIEAVRQAYVAANKPF